jgi:hypothetical protein
LLKACPELVEGIIEFGKNGGFMPNLNCLISIKSLNLQTKRVRKPFSDALELRNLDR